MIALEWILFVAFSVAIVVCAIVSYRLKAEARDLIENEGGTVPLSMRSTLPIDVRQLRGPAVVPAAKSNKWCLLGGAIGIAYLAGLIIVETPPLAFSLMIAFVILLLILCGIHTYRISQPQEPDDGAEPQAAP